MQSLAELSDPIVAIATAPGRGAVGMLRLSVPAQLDLQPLIQALCRRELQARRASYGPFLDAGGQVLDQGLALYFPAPHSYTGEQVLELQGHGGDVILQLLLARCLEAAAQVDAASKKPLLPHLRLARPGEFTQRAYLNGKLDLAQAEAVADLIDASTAHAARSAVRSLAGGFSAQIAALLEQLIKLRILVEATLDFPEEDLDFLSQADARGQLASLLSTLAGVWDQAQQGAILRDGMRVVLAGQPNVGKSALLNALAGAELAIVTPVAGTTRDRLQQTIQIDGVPVHVMDTAGLRDTDDVVERIGVQRSWQAIAEADTVLLLEDLTRVHEAHYQAAQAEIQAQLRAAGVRAEQILPVYNKVDSAQPLEPVQGVLLSAHTGQGLQELRSALLKRVGWHSGAEGLLIARARHVQALQTAQAHFLSAQSWLTGERVALDLLAEELRLAQNCLGTITGEFGADDLLGEIFSRFCIGK